MVEFRQEKAGDESAIRSVNEQTFGSSAEADLIEALRRRKAVALSMVALESDNIAAHILFTEVTIRNRQSQPRALALGPMAVLPEYQRKGIGSKLLEASMEKCRELGCEAVFVLGYPAFYSKFGFVPAGNYGLKCEFDVPDGVFMALELRSNVLVGCAGTVIYNEQFKQFEK